MKSIFIAILLLPAISFAWEFQGGFSVQQYSSPDYEEGSHSTLYIAAREGRFSNYNFFSYNTNFGLQEKVWDGEFHYLMTKELDAWLKLSLGSDAVASNRLGYGGGVAWQVFPMLNLNVDIVKRAYLNSDYWNITWGADLETPADVMVSPRVLTGETDFHQGGSDSTLSWSVKLAHLKLPVRPYVFYGQGEELDPVLGGLQTRVIKSSFYGGGLRLFSVGKNGINLHYEYHDLESLNQTYSFYTFRLERAF